MDWRERREGVQYFGNLQILCFINAAHTGGMRKATAVSKAVRGLGYSIGHGHG